MHECVSMILTSDAGEYVVFVCNECGVISEGDTQTDALPEAINHVVANQFVVK